MKTVIATLLAVVALSTVAMAQEATTKAKKPTQAQMLAAVCPTKAVMSDKLKAACADSQKIASLQLTSTVTVKAPAGELKVLYANREFFK